MTVSALVTSNADGMHVCKQDDRALPDDFIHAGLGKFFANNQVRGAEDFKSFTRDLADQSNSEAGAWERLAIHNRGRNAELATNRADLVLEQLAKRLHEFELEVLWQTANVVVRLDVCGTVSAS